MEGDDYSEVRIVEATGEHLSELSGLERAYMEHHKDLDEYFACKTDIAELWTKYMEEILEDDDHVAYCAIIGDRIVGYVTAQMAKRPPIYETEKVGMIGDAYVLPEYRGQGLFTLLYEEAIEWIKKKGATDVEHPVAVKNEVALKVWRKKGFEDIMVFMRKKL